MILIRMEIDEIYDPYKFTVVEIILFDTGLTQAAIPSLVQRGIAAVSVGVNPGTSPPAVPPLFRWNFEGKEVMATWHPGIFIS